MQDDSVGGVESSRTLAQGTFLGGYGLDVGTSKDSRDNSIHTQHRGLIGYGVTNHWEAIAKLSIGPIVDSHLVPGFSEFQVRCRLGDAVRPENGEFFLSWLHMSTATFAARIERDSQNHFQSLASAMWDLTMAISADRMSFMTGNWGVKIPFEHIQPLPRQKWYFLRSGIGLMTMYSARWGAGIELYGDGYSFFTVPQVWCLPFDGFRLKTGYSHTLGGGSDFVQVLGEMIW